MKKVAGLNHASSLKLNVGCGSQRKQGWLNIDLAESADLQLDVREKLPFQDGSVAMIYSEHFLEHLRYPDEVNLFLQESWRVLQAGGAISIGVPDCEWPVKCYATGNLEWFSTARSKWFPEWCTTYMHGLNYLFHQGGDHKHGYDFETISSVFAECGFINIERRAFDKTQDSPEREWGTLYLTARKPGLPGSDRLE